MGTPYINFRAYIFIFLNMVKKRQARHKKNVKSSPKHIGDGIFALLSSMGGGRDRSNLAGLWQNWSQIMGENFAGLVSDVWHNDRTLLIAAEDAMQMQDLHLQAEEILARANGFLQTDYFTDVKIVLAGYRQKKKRESAPENSGARAQAEKPMRDRCSETFHAQGTYLGQMRKDSPVARCYALFAKNAK